MDITNPLGSHTSYVIGNGGAGYGKQVRNKDGNFIIFTMHKPVGYEEYPITMIQDSDEIRSYFKKIFTLDTREQQILVEDMVTIIGNEIVKIGRPIGVIEVLQNATNKKFRPTRFSLDFLSVLGITKIHGILFVLSLSEDEHFRQKYPLIYYDGQQGRYRTLTFYKYLKLHRDLKKRERDTLPLYDIENRLPREEQELPIDDLPPPYSERPIIQ